MTRAGSKPLLARCSCVLPSSPSTLWSMCLPLLCSQEFGKARDHQERRYAPCFHLNVCNVHSRLFELLESCPPLVVAPAGLNYNRFRPLPIQFSHAWYDPSYIYARIWVLMPPAGFTLLALNFFATGQDLIGAVCFVLSLGFKQMALYYAPAIGTYLLAKCLYLGPYEGYVYAIHSICLSLTTGLAPNCSFV